MSVCLQKAEKRRKREMPFLPIQRPHGDTGQRIAAGIGSQDRSILQGEDLGRDVIVANHGRDNEEGVELSPGSTRVEELELLDDGFSGLGGRYPHATVAPASLLVASREEKRFS